MGIQVDVKNKIKEFVETNLTDYKEMKFSYEIELNSSTVITSYAVRFGSAQTVKGTNKTATFDQDFSIELARKFITASESDKDLKDKIDQLYNDHETLYEKIYRENLSIAGVLLVQSIRLTEPKIIADNSLVTIEAIYSVKYRTGVI